MLVSAEEVANGDSGHVAGLEPERDVDRDKSSNVGRDISLTMLLREFIFCAALALTTYGALHTSPSKISRQAPATRFFPADSPVTDWYRGQLGPALSAASREDISVMMYYAPWDAECQHVRREFDIAARLLSDQVYFAAINCWNPGSECRMQHNKIPSWPVIMAYTVNSKGILYRGPRDAHSLVKFVEMVSRPLQRISNMADLVHLVSVCDVVVVGSTPLASGSKHYKVWYSAALKWRESDPLGDVCLGVVTAPELARELVGGGAPALRMLLFNSTLDFDGGEGRWTEGHLTEWMSRSLTRVAARVAPAWQKSSALQSFIGDSPALLLFTPLEPLYDQMPAYDLLREVAMEYHDCTNSEWTQEIIRLQQTERSLYSLRDPRAACSHHNLTRTSAPNKIVSSVKIPWHNSTLKKSSKNNLYSMLLRNNVVRTVTGGKVDALFVSSTEECANGDQFGENHAQQCDVAEKLQFDGEEVTAPEEDELSGSRLLARQAELRCRLLDFAASRSPPVLPLAQNHTSVRGLACRTNATLRFIAIDSIRNHHFAESLGVDINRRPDRTAVVILDSKSESQYEMRSGYGEASLRDFVRDFTLRRLKRALRSAVERPRHTHGYSAAGADGALQVLELTTKSFGRFVKKSGETSIVLVCGGACPGHATRAVLSATRLLARYSIRCRAARVDAHRHDLPWHYTVHAYPTILVFPADRRLESGSYPSSERVTTAGLVSLVARTLGPPTELKLQLALCNNAPYTEAKRDCLSALRQHAYRLIERALRHWRRHADARHAALGRLARLGEIVWALCELHESYLNPGDHRQEKLLDSLDQLDKAWRYKAKKDRKHSEL